MKSKVVILEIEKKKDACELKNNTTCLIKADPLYGELFEDEFLVIQTLEIKRKLEKMRSSDLIDLFSDISEIIKLE